MIALLAWWILVVHGVTQIVTVSKIFAPLRDWTRLPGSVRTLLHCPMCFGFWAGIAGSLLGEGPARWLSHWPAWGAALADGVAASGVCWAIFVIQARLGARDL